MPADLTTPRAISRTVHRYHITSYVDDMDNSTLLLYYQERDSLDNKLEDKFHEVIEPDYSATWLRANQISNQGNNVRYSRRIAFLERLTSDLGDEATIS